MKKVLSIVLAVLMVLSLSAVAFAAEVKAEETTPGSVDVENDENKDYILGFGDLIKDPTVDADPDKPGATYYFTILDETDESGMLTDKEVAKHLSVTIKETGDAMIKDYCIQKHNGVYKVKVTTNAFDSSAVKKATWAIVLKKDKKFTEAKAEFAVKQAWAAAEENHYATDGDEGIVYVSNEESAKPGVSYDIYTDDANLCGLYTFDKAYKYVTMYIFDGEEATPVWFSVKNTHEVKGTVLVDTKVEKALVLANEDAEEISAVSFKGDMEFDYVGIQHVAVDEDMFVYAKVDGKLVAGKFEWNKDAECWETKTTTPIDVVISDVELKDVATAAADKANPGTGSVDFVNVAVALGVVSLAAAGAVALKK